MARIGAALPLLLLLASSAAAAGWPQWRGPDRTGVTSETIARWPPVKLWEFDVGRGVTSAIAEGGRAYAMGHRDGADTIWCLDAASGSVLWRFSYPCKGDQTSDVRFPGPRSTPATDGELVFGISLEGHIHALDARTGTLRWSKGPRETGASAKQQYGVCSSPLIAGGMLIADVATSCIAFDRGTGRELWRAPGSGGWNGAGPMPASFGGTSCILYGTGRCVDAATGRERWCVEYGEWSVTTPIIAGDRFFLSPFHGRNLGGKGCAVLECRGGARPAVLWNNDEVEALCITGVLWKGNLYAADRDDLAISGESGQKMNLKCIDFATGAVAWTERPLSWPTPIIAGDKLLVQTLNGDLILVDPTPQAFRELGRAKGAVGRCWTVPALAEGRLYCKDNRGIISCFSVTGREGSGPAATEPAEVARVGVTTRGERRDEQALAPPAVAGAPESRAGWPRFRGPAGDGVAAPGSYSIAWDGATGAGILWKAAVPLRGYSSPVVSEDRVFVTGANESRRELYCFEAATGALLWRRSVEQVPGSRPGQKDHWTPASYAAPTPAVEGGRVCAMFGNGDVACFDLAGALVWSRNMGPLRNSYGHASSPVIVREHIVLVLDQGEAEAQLSRIMALDARTGRLAWERARDVGASWCTPIVVRAGGTEQLVASGIPWVAAYDPSSGTELWRSDSLDGGFYAVPSPIGAGGMILAVTDGAVLAAIKPSGAGDVSRTHVAWTVEGELPAVPSPVSDGKLVYLLTSGGVLTCHDLATGDQAGQRDCSREGRSFEASPVLAGGRIYVQDDAGEMVILKAGRELEEIGRSTIVEPCDGGSPAFAGGRIYLRGRDHLWCVREVNE